MSDIQLWDHQILAIKRAKEKRDLALLLEAGTGKTATTIHILRDKYNTEKRILRTLIIGPLIVVPQWGREFEKFSKVPPGKITLLHKSGAGRLKTFEKATSGNPLGFIAITNYEALLSPDFYKALCQWRPEIVILDESHRVKDSTSKRFKLLKGLCDVAKSRYILTGTPVLNSPLDLWAQYRLLDQGKTFGDNFFVFRATYLYDKNAGMPKHVYFPNWVPRPAAAKQLSERISSTAVQAKKEDCLTLPPFVRVEVPVEMGEDQAKAYEEMKKHYVTLVQGQAIAANLAIVQTLRLQTILSGFIANPDRPEKPLLFKENPRLDALVDLVEDLVKSGQVLIWCNFVANYQAISDALAKKKITVLQLTGQESVSQKEENAAKLRAGEVQALICHPRAAGLGINLVEAKYSVYFTRSYSLEDDVQSEARNFRAGSEMHDRITRYDLFVPDTLDEVVLKALKAKSDLGKAILAWANK